MPFSRSLSTLIPIAVALAAMPLQAQSDPAPAVPLGVGMSANSSNSITLDWFRSGTNDAASYTVYMSERAEGPFTKLASVADTTATHSNLPPGATYYYKVSAATSKGESAQSAAASGFTIAPWEPKPFPAKIAKNMCVSLGSPITCSAKPLAGKLTDLVDGSDATSCRLRKDFEIKIKLDPAIPISDADYLLLHFRSDCGKTEWSNDRLRRTLRDYVIIESTDSTDGSDGTWQEIAAGTNELLDSVIVLPNHRPKWIGVRSSYQASDEVPKADDRRLHPGDLILSRLDIFRSAPAGYRNDYWIFTGDSLIVGDMPAGKFEGRSALFSDLIRAQHPDRYPIVVHAGRGGEMLKDTLPRTEKALSFLSPDNGTPTATATIVCWETGYNDVGVRGSLAHGARLIKSYQDAQRMCENKGLIMVPVRIEFSTQYLNLETLEPTKGVVFVNSLAINLGGVDVFARTHAPYACNPKTQLPYADYWTYTRNNFATALAKDGVHHTAEGADGINRLWAEVADKMIYTPQKQ